MITADAPVAAGQGPAFGMSTADTLACLGVIMPFVDVDPAWTACPTSVMPIAWGARLP